MKQKNNFFDKLNTFQIDFSSLYGAVEVPKQRYRYANLLEKTLDIVAHPKNSMQSNQELASLRFYSAPGRTELGGNHTDHNRGKVLCASVGLDIVACVLPRIDSQVLIVSEGYPPIQVDLAQLSVLAAERGKPESLIRGVAKGLYDRKNQQSHRPGEQLQGFSACIHSEVLPGSGLSSSAAFEVLIATIIADIHQMQIPPLEIAQICQSAENHYFGKPCGLMDQSACAIGGVVHLDFAHPTNPEFCTLPYNFENEGYILLVVNTGGSHSQLTQDYAAIPQEMKSVAAYFGKSYLREVSEMEILENGMQLRECCGDRAVLRTLHYLSENTRVDAMLSALQNNRLPQYFNVVRESGDSSWMYLQNMVPSAAQQSKDQGLGLGLALSKSFIGNQGAYRVHGGGFAGTIQVYLRKEKYPEYCQLMHRYFGSDSVIPLSIRPFGACKIATKVADNQAAKDYN